MLALHEVKVVRVSTAGFLDSPEPLFPVPRVIRLGASDPEAPEQVVVLNCPVEGTADLGLLDLAERKVRSLRAEAPPAEYQDVPSGTRALGLDPADRRVVWGREPPSPPVSGASTSASRVAARVNISHCTEYCCSQLALSPGGRWVVFVRTPAPKP
jgi:hypothetical protein